MSYGATLEVSPDAFLCTSRFFDLDLTYSPTSSPPALRTSPTTKSSPTYNPSVKNIPMYTSPTAHSGSQSREPRNRHARNTSPSSQPRPVNLASSRIPTQSHHHYRSAELQPKKLLMMINNRPESQAELYLVVEDVEARMNEKEQGVVLDCVKKCFGGQWGDEAVEGRSTCIPICLCSICLRAPFSGVYVTTPE
ncbi:hypothetical protein L211DRAFT_852667 [Terfezia boudieri ATCC MYA-4762]|uniref:Uncharacterized protein n=1 Tax=Terfezia boudieri ATCC MYA-4762 TaxID=1051890 RepID=A0A3N4LB11_9PEZI|nr:hypothetical protein L211DRAFT_852667 [Terfezia boudieri ATCC MYA-4762]